MKFTLYLYIFKIQKAAEQNKLIPKTFCDNISNEFKSSFVKANISFDDFIRTSEPRHKVAVEKMWNTLKEKNFIYLGQYEGWYSISDEAFLSDDEVTPIEASTPLNSEKKEMKSILSGHKVDWVREENYKFRLKEFKEKLQTWVNENQGYIKQILEKSNYSFILFLFFFKNFSNLSYI